MRTARPQRRLPVIVREILRTCSNPHVALLFSDLVGSTELASGLGSVRMEQVRREQFMDISVFKVICERLLIEAN